MHMCERTYPLAHVHLQCTVVFPRPQSCMSWAVHITRHTTSCTCIAMKSRGYSVAFRARTLYVRAHYVYMYCEITDWELSRCVMTRIASAPRRILLTNRNNIEWGCLVQLTLHFRDKLGLDNPLCFDWQIWCSNHTCAACLGIILAFGSLSWDCRNIWPIVFLAWKSNIFGIWCRNLSLFGDILIFFQTLHFHIMNNVFYPLSTLMM